MDNFDVQAFCEKSIQENLLLVLCDDSSYHDRYKFKPEDVKILFTSIGGGKRLNPINALAILWSVTASWTSTQEKLIIAERNKLKNARHNKLIMIQLNKFNSALHEKLRIVRHNKLMKARE